MSEIVPAVDIPARLNLSPNLSGDESNAGLPLNVFSPAYSASLRVFAGAGQLYGFSGYNSGSAGFVLWMNASLLPADAVAPSGFIAVPAATNFSVDWGQYGRHFDVGCFLVYSSTGPTKTIGAASCFFDAQYV